MLSFTEALGAMDDDELHALIQARPDAFFPTPPTTGSLATRLALPGSAARAVRQLTAADLAVLEWLADEGAELSPIDASGADLSHLRTLALVFGPDDQLRIAPGTLSALPPGWRVTDTLPPGAEQELVTLSPRERKVLETLAASGGVGTTAQLDPGSPVAALLEKRLLTRVDEHTVRLPRPVRDLMRGLTPRVFPLTQPPADDADQETVDQAATTQGLDAVRQMRQLLMALMDTPVALNKDGSVGVRAATNLEKRLGFDPRLMVTLGESAGLIGRGNADDAAGTDVLAATREALVWLDAPLAQQWAALLTGWFASPWRPDAEANLLSEEARSPAARHARATILQHEGDPQRLLFFAPLEGFSPSLVRATVADATALGALAPTLSSPAHTLFNGNDVEAVAGALVPEAVDTLIAQADMTVLAPGPLEPHMAAMLEQVAELESPGLASVWRVTERAVRRGLDGGLTAEEMHAWLQGHVIGEIPQAITFLIDDVSRHHGAIRAGAALSYVRSGDAALIATAAKRVGLRILAPTVAVSQLPLPKLMTALRAAGLQPTAEDATGATLNLAPEPALVPATPSAAPRPPKVAPEQAETIIQTLRSGDAPAEEASGNTFETLRAAARGRRRVTVGFVDKQGRGRTLTVLPLSVSAGQVDALDEAADRVVRIALPRITKVVLSG